MSLKSKRQRIEEPIEHVGYCSDLGHGIGEVGTKCGFSCLKCNKVCQFKRKPMRKITCKPMDCECNFS